MKFTVNSYFRSKGRNGFDKLGIFTWSVSIALFIVTVFSHSFYVYIIAVALLAWSVCRMMSKKIDRRYLEEQTFLKFFYNIKYFFSDTKNWFSRKKFASVQNRERKRVYYSEKEKARADAKLYKYYSCPDCSQKVRVPRGHGKIEITCPKCGRKFIKRT